MQRTFKYKLEPTFEQREALFHIFNFCRFLYNSALEDRINFYKKTKSSKKYKEKLMLKEREYHCETCGLAIDRDINAAKNIRKLGTSFAIFQEISEAPKL